MGKLFPLVTYFRPIAVSCDHMMYINIEHLPFIAKWCEQKASRGSHLCSTPVNIILPWCSMHISHSNHFKHSLCKYSLKLANNWAFKFPPALHKKPHLILASFIWYCIIQWLQANCHKILGPLILIDLFKCCIHKLPLSRDFF